MISLRESTRTAEAVKRLLQLPDFSQEFLEWIKNSREQRRDQNETANGNEVYRGSGRSMELSDLLSEIESAPEIVDGKKVDRGNLSDIV